MATKNEAQRIQELADDNPEADAEQAERALTLVEALRELGLAAPRYDLTSPHGRRIGHCRHEDERSSTWK